MSTMKMLQIAVLAFPMVAGAQTVDKELPGSGDWKAAQISGHDLWKRSACLAYTKSTDGKSVLEFYAEAEGDKKGSFVEPTIQVITKEAGYVRATLVDNNESSKFQLTLASTREAKPAFGLLARFSDRAKIIDMLKKAAGAKLQLFNAKGKLLKAVSFSLKGSTKTIDSAISGCQLML